MYVHMYICTVYMYNVHVCTGTDNANKLLPHLMWHLLHSVQSTDVVQSVDGGRETTVKTEDLHGVDVDVDVHVRISINTTCVQSIAQRRYHHVPCKSVHVRMHVHCITYMYIHTVYVHEKHQDILIPNHELHVCVEYCSCTCTCVHTCILYSGKFSERSIQKYWVKI